MREFFLGIDIGTSAVKGLARDGCGNTIKARRAYKYAAKEEILASWRTALKELIAELNEKVRKTGGKFVAVAFSSQVGTYIVNGRDVISWQSPCGKEELKELKAKFSDERFICEIGMKHPDIISYPLPRLLYIQKTYGRAEVFQPKDYFIRELTGVALTDVYSLRGAVNPKTGLLAEEIMREAGIKNSLPQHALPNVQAGKVTEKGQKEYGLTQGTPVYLGCNDFFAGLLGMGVYNAGTAFDLSGTSEHVGFISDKLEQNASVSGAYFNGFCSYGGTKASGSACDFAIKNFGIEGLDLCSALSSRPPIFLPYLCGERAPIYDENARGVYFGINTGTDNKQLAYSALEGVVFSLYDIAEDMKMPKAESLVCGGGSAANSLMNTIKAELFDCPVSVVKENDASALGACILAMFGSGYKTDLPSAVSENVEIEETFLPSGEYRVALLNRFAIYKDVYNNLKESFKKLN